MWCRYREIEAPPTISAVQHERYLMETNSELSDTRNLMVVRKKEKEAAEDMVEKLRQIRNCMRRELYIGD